MGYLHIKNLYKDQTILKFKQCYALEKIHGTSAHIGWGKDRVYFFSGGEKHDNFVALFDADKLTEKFVELGHEKVVIYGEAYGGKMQGMSATYGKELKFVAFDVKIGENWLDVPNAQQVVESFGLEFVSYALINTTLEEIDAERDRFSVQAIRNGVGTEKLREGVVLRPLIEVTLNSGERVIAKHKRDEFRETKSPRDVGAELELKVKAKEIADEWVTPMRLTHVLAAHNFALEMENTGHVIAAMKEDVRREAVGEIVESKEVMAKIGQATALMFKQLIKAQLREVL